MKNIILAFTTLLLVSFSNPENQNYYNRPENKESVELNQVLPEFLRALGHTNPKIEIFLKDTLKPINKSCATCVRNWAAKETDKQIEEAMLDFASETNEPVLINFSQIKNYQGYNFNPGKTEFSDFLHWEYTLSLPGFSSDSSVMVFRCFHKCGNLDSGASLQIYRKSNNQWNFDHERLF